MNSSGDKNHGGGDDEVGYCKPPKHTQFKKGQSGNPSGKRKREKVASDPNPVREVLSEMIQTTAKDGTRKKMPTIKVLIKKHVSLAMGGDHKSAELLLKYCGSLEEFGHWKRENLAGLPKYPKFD